MNEQAKFRLASGRYFNTHGFCSVHEFLMFKNDLQYCYQLCDFRFLLWCKWYLRSSGILRSVSGHTGCNLFVWKYNSVLYEIPEEHRSHLLSAVYSTMNLVYHFNTLCEILVFVLYILHFCYLFHIVLSLKLNFLCIICIMCVCVCVFMYKQNFPDSLYATALKNLLFSNHSE